MAPLRAARAALALLISLPWDTFILFAWLLAASTSAWLSLWPEVPVPAFAGQPALPHWLWWAPLLRLLRLVGALRLWGPFSALAQETGAHQALSLARVCILLFLVQHSMACAWMALGASDVSRARAAPWH